MNGPPSTGRTTRLFARARSEWREIGGLGRFGLLGLGASLLIAIALGFSITRGARSHLLDARSDLLQVVVDDIAAEVPEVPVAGSPAYARFDVAIRLRLLGGETVRVKLWDASGRIAYSDAPELVGEEFGLAEPAQRAFEGEPSSRISDLSDPAHAADRDFGELIEFYVPYGPAESPLAVFEIEQQTESLNTAMGRISRNVWLSIGSGLLVLALFLGVLAVGRSRDLNRRRRQAEKLLGSLLQAQDDERRRIVGALHDDVGQPLYRLLYGLEGSRAKLPADDALVAELTRLEDVVREVDATLRAELRLLHESVVSDAGLAVAIDELVAVTERETELEISVNTDLDREPESVPRAALYRAAQEGLTNIRKHSGASHVTLRIRGDEHRVALDLEDDGAGTKAVPGLGLTTTRERLESIGGGLSIESHRGRGTCLRAWVPLRVGDVR
jgi:signal transduction histidine kinase